MKNSLNTFIQPKPKWKIWQLFPFISNNDKLFNEMFYISYCSKQRIFKRDPGYYKVNFQGWIQGRTNLHVPIHLSILDKNMWKCCEKPVNCSISHVFHTFFTGCETVETLWTGHFSQGQNPCKTLWKTLWVFLLWKNLWKAPWKPCELSQCFSQGRRCQNLWTGHFSQEQNLSKTLWNGC